MAFSNELVHFVGETHPDDDPSETTSKMAGLCSFGPSSGRRWSWQQAATAFRRLIDEEEDEEGNEGETSSPGEEEKKSDRKGKP
ncbi:UNVERIFIED_CONTAM: hypothetical protein Sradi_0915500 [Sesamum radiatum]|uniref:Uncharacterized protein n=1 Tax=Sesamum radiatum TaxID=300843 RepID=A0AAW2V3B0_SESRA